MPGSTHARPAHTLCPRRHLRLQAHQLQVMSRVAQHGMLEERLGIRVSCAAAACEVAVSTTHDVLVDDERGLCEKL